VSSGRRQQVTPAVPQEVPQRTPAAVLGEGVVSARSWLDDLRKKLGNGVEQLRSLPARRRLEEAKREAAIRLAETQRLHEPALLALGMELLTAAPPEAMASAQSAALASCDADASALAAEASAAEEDAASRAVEAASAVAEARRNLDAAETACHLAAEEARAAESVSTRAAEGVCEALRAVWVDLSPAADALVDLRTACDAMVPPPGIAAQLSALEALLSTAARRAEQAAPSVAASTAEYLRSRAVAVSAEELRRQATTAHEQAQMTLRSAEAREAAIRETAAKAAMDRTRRGGAVTERRRIALKDLGREVFRARIHAALSLPGFSAGRAAAAALAAAEAEVARLARPDASAEA